MKFDDVREVFRPLMHPLDDGTSVGMTRTLMLGDLCVVAHGWLDGTEVSIHREGDDETYITAEEWPVVQEMVRRQMEWAVKA